MDERLRVETAISLLESSKKDDIDRLKTAKENYELAKKACEPFISDIRTGMETINRTYKEAGMNPPFVLSYADLENDLAAKKAHIKDVEAKRDAARKNYDTIDADIEKYPGLTYGEVKARKDEARKEWDKYNDQFDEAWRAYRAAEAKMNSIDKKDFDKKCNSYEYLKELIASKKDELSSTMVVDERTTNIIKVGLYSLEVSSDSLKSKFGVLNDSIKVFDEVGQKLGITLVYDEEINNTINLDSKKEVVKEEPKKEKEEQVEKETPVVEPTTKEVVVDTPDVINLGDGSETEKVKEEGLSVINPVRPREEKVRQGEPDAKDFIHAAGLNDQTETGDLTDEEKETISKIVENNKKLDEVMPFGKRLKITAIQTAQIAPLLATNALAIAISAAALGGFFPLAPVLLVGTGFNLASHALYNIYEAYTGRKNEKMEQIIKGDISPTFVAAVVNKAAKGFMDTFKKMPKMPKFKRLSKEEKIDKIRTEAYREKQKRENYAAVKAQALIDEPEVLDPMEAVKASLNEEEPLNPENTMNKMNDVLEELKEDIDRNMSQKIEGVNEVIDISEYLNSLDQEEPAMGRH